MVNKKAAAAKSTSASTKSSANSKALVSTKKTPVVDKKMAAANDVQPVVEVPPTPAPAPKAESTAAKTKKEKAPKQEFLPKLRSKGDLLKALKADGILFLENGLWRLDPGRPDQKVHRVSKRRAVAFRSAELVVPTTKDARGHGNAFVLNLAKVAELEKSEKKAAQPAPAAADSKAVAK